jgi:acyl dehydratase
MEYLSKEEKTNLENRLNIELSRLENIIPTEDERVDFRRSIRDDNAIHSDIEKAKELGFDTTPLVGPYYPALIEIVSENFAEILKEYNPQLIQTGQKIEFIRAIYPGDKTISTIENYEGSLRDNNLNVEMSIKRNGKKRAIDLTAKFGIQKPADINLPGKLLYTHEFSGEDELTSEDVSNFYKGIRNEPLEKMTNTQVTSLGLAGLLNFLKKLNEYHGTNYLGANQGMNSTFISPAQPGDFEVEIYKLAEETQSRKGYSFPFHVKVKQDAEVKAYSNIKCLSNGLLDVESLCT